VAGALGEPVDGLEAAGLEPAGRLAPRDVALRAGVGVEVPAGAVAVVCAGETPSPPVVVGFDAVVFADELCGCDPPVPPGDPGEVLTVGGGVAWVETGQPTARPEPPFRDVLWVVPPQDRPGGYGAALPDVDGSRNRQHATQAMTIAPQRYRQHTMAVVTVSPELRD
jgi:hypothetical protein